MPKVSIVCANCGQTFERFPTFLRHAEARGSEVKFCSRRCTDEARSKGLIGTKKRRGATLTCEVCSAPFYRSASKVERNGRFCSEPCRKRAFKEGLIDRTAPRPGALRGEEITCMFCGTTVYRKRSMIDRKIAKTCGSTECISAYGRSLWGLEPREVPAGRNRATEKAARKGRNFTAAQRVAWLDTKCARCGSTENLMLDHIVAVCNGGLPTRENAQTLCGPCNNWKAKHIDRPLARQQSHSGG